jgi:hypothetical protein
LLPVGKPAGIFSLLLHLPQRRSRAKTAVHAYAPRLISVGRYWYDILFAILENRVEGR